MSTLDRCCSDDGCFAACKCTCCQRAMCRICFNAHLDLIDLESVGNALSNQLADFSTQLNTVHKRAMDQLTQWYKCKKVELKKERIKYELALREYFEEDMEGTSMKQKRAQIYSRLETTREQLQHAIKIETATKSTVNTFKELFSALASEIQNDLYDSIEKNGKSSIPAESSKEAPSITTTTTESETRQETPAAPSQNGGICKKQPSQDKSQSKPATSIKATTVVILRHLDPYVNFVSLLEDGLYRSLLYKKSSSDPFYYVQSFHKTTKNMTPQTLIKIPDILDFCQIQTKQSYVFVTAHTLFLYNSPTLTQSYRKPIETGGGQAVACNNSFLLCKTTHALHFYRFNLQTIHKTWKDKTMQLDQYHTIDVDGLIVGLCGKFACCFYRIIGGDQCEPELLLHIKQGGSDIMISSMMENKSTTYNNKIHFILTKREENKIELYNHETHQETIKTNKPLQCLRLREGKNIGHSQILILCESPNRIEVIEVRALP